MYIVVGTLGGLLLLPAFGVVYVFTILLISQPMVVISFLAMPVTILAMYCKLNGIEGFKQGGFIRGYDDKITSDFVICSYILLGMFGASLVISLHQMYK